MNETKFARSRRAAVIGLMLQLAAFATCLVLAFASGSAGIASLAWFILGGAPIWFVTLLVQRQKELAELERLDYEELRREKAGMAGEALFETGGAGVLGFQVAENRLEWMQRWLSPAFALMVAAYLALMGWRLWRLAPLAIMVQESGGLAHLPIVLTVLAVLMLLLFLMSRYAAGLGRVAGWQMLRACGSYCFACAIAAAALLAALTVYWYAGTPVWEQWFVRIVPLLMMLLAAEAVVNTVLNIYRPRKAGAESRAAFDSRLLGLFSEPGGIAASIADAVNYQFGFEITRTWFYQLLQRAFVPLIWVGGLALWALSMMVIVYPGEHAVVERWGRQTNAATPWGPGVHFKAPWPIDVAYRFPTGRLQEMLVGYKDFDARPEPEEPMRDGRPEVVLWSQEQHRGLYHFEFIISPKADEAGPATQPAAIELRPALVDDVSERSQSVPVNMIRMVASVQYKIAADRLAEYTQQVAEPQGTLRNIAWGELVKFSASQNIDTLLGGEAGTFNELLRERIATRADELKLGIDVVYVGLYNLHPETTVAEAYRGVIDADQQRTNFIREALIYENQALAAAAGDKGRARGFVLALDQLKDAERNAVEAEQVLGEGGQREGQDASRTQQLEAAILPLRPLFENRAVLEEQLRRAEQSQQSIEQEFEAGVGSNVALRARAGGAVNAARGRLVEAEREINDALAPIRQQWSGDDAAFSAAVRMAQARAKRALWTQYLVREISALEGAAAAKLAQAQAERWDIETQAEAQVRTVQIQGDTFRAAPEVYKIRMYYATLADGLRNARKFFLAFDQEGRDVMTRIVADDEGSVGDIADMNIPSSANP